MPESPRILVAHTGGTIGMARQPSGAYDTQPGHLQAQINARGAFDGADVPAYDIHEFDPLLDSANMTPDHWLKIATTIRDRYDDYDGFLVVHGTDTMAFSAAALSFMLHPLDKPVLFTGSQIPLVETRTDAQSNLLTALLILGAHHARLNGVFLFFNDRLLRGTRATKVNADAFGAFASPNFPPVGRAGINIEIDWSLVPEQPEEQQSPTVTAMGNATVAAFRVFPGLKSSYLNSVLAPPVQGVVLECYGAGNAPTANAAFMDALRTAVDRNIVIVDVTQPLQGTADLNLYATGHALSDAGVVSGYDMTTEAALAKLYYLFEQRHSPDRVRALMQENMRGELTPPDEVPPTLGRSRQRLAEYR